MPELNELDDEEQEGEKILTLDDFRNKALEKLEMKRSQPGKSKK